MNADMLNRGTEDRPAPLPLSLSFFFLRGGGGERPLRPPLDPPLVIDIFYKEHAIIVMIMLCMFILGDRFIKAIISCF
jgi:hypothetical protein